MSNLPSLTISDYYYHSYDKMVKEKMEIEQGCGMGIGGCKRLCPAANGAWLGYTVYLFVSVKDHPLLWMVVRSQTYYLEHILTYGSGKARCSLVMGSGSF